MGLIDRLTGRRTEETSSGVLRIGGTRYMASWSFTRTLDSVYANPTARRCIERLASDFQRPQWQLRKPGTEEDVEEVANPAAYQVLNRPNFAMSGTQMQYHISRDLDIGGSTFWLKLRGTDVDPYQGTGKLVGLRRLPHQRVTVIGDEDDELLGFVYQDRLGRVQMFPREEVVYVHYPHPDRECDRMAPAIVAGLSSETDNVAMRFNFELLANDSALPGYLSIEGLNPAQFQQWKAKWESDEAPGKTRFLGGGKASYTKVGQTNQELTYGDLRNASREDICRAFGLAKVLIDPTDATFANMGMATANHIKSNELPRWSMVADEMTLQLGPELGNLEIGFNLDQIEELQEGLDAYVIRTMPLVDRRIKTINEVRADLGLPPVAWGDEPLNAIGAGPVPPQVAEIDSAPAVDADPLDLTAQTSGDTERNYKAPSATSPLWGFDSHLDRAERRCHSTLLRFFERQARAIEKRLSSRKSLAKAVEDWWDAGRWNEELTTLISPLLGDTVDAIGTLALASFNDEAAFKTSTNHITNYLDRQSRSIAALVNDTTAADVRSRLIAMAKEGGSIDEMAKEISGYFDDSADMRALRVSRTEMIGAANWGAIEGARQSGVVHSKQWLAASDAEANCSALSGVTVPLESSFGPVDHPPLHPNCRCTVVFLTGTEETH